MSGELKGGSAPGLTLYAQLLSTSDARWNGSAFEVYSSANYGLYTIPVTEQGNSGIYVGNFPSAITVAGSFEAIYYRQEGGSPTEGDPIAGSESIDWDGSGTTTPPGTITGAMSGSDWLTYVIRAFKRTDKNTEIFDATKDTIDDLRRRLVMPEDETEIQTTDTIMTIGDYRIDLEQDFGLLIAEVFVQSSNSNGWQLRKISKREFDRKYSVFGSDLAVHGTPKEYCIFAGQILVGPIPNLTTYIYKINYTQDSLAGFDVASLSIPFTDRYRQILRWGVLAAVYSDILKNDDQAAKFGTLYENGLKMIERRNDRNRTGVSVVRYQGF